MCFLLLYLLNYYESTAIALNMHSRHQHTFTVCSLTCIAIGLDDKASTYISHFLMKLHIVHKYTHNHRPL